MQTHCHARFWRTAALALAATALTACAELGLPGPAPQQAACCATVAGLPFATLALGTETTLGIDAASPVVELPGGRSPVAAVRLPDGPRPLVVDLVSRQVPPQGVAAAGLALLGLARPGRTAIDVMNPSVWIVDARHGLVREIAATAVTERCDSAYRDGDGPVFHLRATITEPPDQAAYLIVGTSDRQRAAPTPRRCPGVELRFGDRGRIDLTVRGVAPDDPVVAVAAASWQRGTGPASALAPPLQRGRLVVDARRVAYDQPEGSRFVRVLDLPLDSLVGVHGSAGMPNEIQIASVEGSPARVRWDRFALPPDTPAGDSGYDALFERLKAQVRPDWFTQTVAFAVPPWSVEPSVRFESPAPRSAGSTPAAEADSALYRIGQDAAAAGIVTALPCGLCAAGGCGPAMLAPCAALFSVGAVIGGAWSAGKELLGLARRPSPPSKAPAGSAPAAAPTAAASAAPPASAPVVSPTALVASFDRSTLEACIARAVAEADPDAWRIQGRTARPQVVPPAADGDAAHAAAGVRLLVEPRVMAIELVVDRGAGDDAPAPDAEARLRVVATLRAVDLASRQEWARPFTWTGRWQPLSAWGEAAPADIGRELSEACRNIAAASEELGRVSWRDLR